MEKQTSNQQASVFEGFSKRLQMTDAIELTKQSLHIQIAVNRVATDRRRPTISLINPDEEARIRELIAAETWPNKWRAMNPEQMRRWI